MRRLARPVGILSAAAGAALAAVLAVSGPASAASADVPVNYDCQATPPLLSPTQLSLPESVQADAPDTVAAGDAFTVTLTPDPMTVPSTASGYAVKTLSNLALSIPVPQGATLSSATVSGGSNLGSGTPTVSVANGVITVAVPGPIAGGSTIQLPALTLNLTATGDSGSSINVQLSGTSYTAPGLTFSASVQVGFFPVNVPVSCFPNPSPTLTTTTIS